MRAMASPAAAHLVLARLSGPVGLADTNSTLMRRPASASPLPYVAPASTIVRASSPSEPADRVMLRNPAPASKHADTAAWTASASSPEFTTAMLVTVAGHLWPGHHPGGGSHRGNLHLARFAALYPPFSAEGSQWPSASRPPRRRRGKPLPVIA